MTSPVAPVPHRPERLRRRAEFGSILITEAWHPGSTSIPAHHHATATLTFVLNGGFVECMDGSPRETDVTGLLYRPAMMTHRDRIGPAGVLTLGVALAVTASIGGLEWQRLLPAPCCASHPDIRLMAGRLRREVGNRDDLSALAVEATVAELLLGLCRHRWRGGRRRRPRLRAGARSGDSTGVRRRPARDKRRNVRDRDGRSRLRRSRCPGLAPPPRSEGRRWPAPGAARRCAPRQLGLRWPGRRWMS